MDGYKIGIRSEKLGRSIHFGLGYVWYTEKCLVLSFLVWEIYIGKIYDMAD